MSHEVLIVTREPFVQPNMAPPKAGYAIAEPHVGILLHNVANSKLLVQPSIGNTGLLHKNIIPVLQRHLVNIKPLS